MATRSSAHQKTAKTHREVSHAGGQAGKSATRGAKGKDSAAGDHDGSLKLDRRGGLDRRSGNDRRKQNLPVPVERRKLQRRAKVARRRQIDPTTCERDYTADEIEFMNAMDEYKRLSGRMFPTCSEVLEVIRKLGYEKRPAVAPNCDAQPATTS